MAIHNEPDIDPMVFEESVRRVARQLFVGARVSGATKIDGRERDEVIDTGTELIVVEVTTSRKLEKTKNDLNKSIDLVKKLRSIERFSEYNFRILIVTSSDPTADQNDYVKNAKSGCPKEIISFPRLYSRLFDARSYLALREEHAFGSVRDPSNEQNFKVPPSDYVPTALIEEGGASFKARKFAEEFSEGGRCFVFGEYGSGKSMTLRDIYFYFREKFLSGRSLQCPIYLNLREHIAQVEPDEALYRHADKVGFENSASLISAWRAGYVAIFLDGFDELIPSQFATSVKDLRQARRFAVEIVKRFMEQTPQNASIIVAGRENYFDSREEAKSALGFARNCRLFDLAGFTDEDVKKFLKNKGANLPSWLPSRPLLLGYLANSGLLSSRDDLFSLPPAAGWDHMLDRVCEREVSQVWGVGFEARDLRLFIDGLATRSRMAREGRGLEDSSLRDVFRVVFGRDADEPASLLTCRLPGLGSIPGKSGAREFIDSDFADAACSGDLKRFIENPFIDQSPLLKVGAPMGDLGREMASEAISHSGAKISIALEKSAETPEMSGTTGDLLLMLIDGGFSYSGSSLCIRDCHFDSIPIDFSLDLSRISFNSCTVLNVELNQGDSTESKRKCMQFHDCVIGRIEGAVSSQDVPIGMLTGSTTVESYAAFAGTNDAVMSSALQDPVKVLLTILRKLYMQSGTGRQIGALKRGIPLKFVPLVEPVLSIVKATGFADTISINRRDIIIPIRSRGRDVLEIVNGPSQSKHLLLEKVRQL